MTQISQTILDKLNQELENKEVVFVGLVGSRFWGQDNENSDWDVITVMHSDEDLFESCKKDNLNIHYWGYKNFETALSKSNPLAWEWLNYCQLIKGNLPSLNHLVDLPLLVERFKRNIAKEFNHAPLTTKEQYWYDRYQMLIKKLENNL